MPRAAKKTKYIVLNSDQQIYQKKAEDTLKRALEKVKEGGVLSVMVHLETKDSVCTMFSGTEDRLLLGSKLILDGLVRMGMKWD